jgi:hypothetical protein
MKPTLRLRNAALAALAGLAFASSGCGVLKSRDDKMIVANQNPALQQGGTSGQGNDPESEEIRQIKQFLDLYTDHGSLTREGLGNLFEKYKTQLAPFLAGTGMTQQQLIDLIFDFDANHDGRITPQELSDGLLKRIPILRWIPDNQTEITRAELDDQIAQEYPAASATARAGLAETLMRFDSAWAEGNANGKLSRWEASGAGIVIGVLAQTDFSHGFQIPPGVIPPVDADPQHPGNNLDITPLVGKMLQQKIDQQLFGRYSVHRSQELSQDDLRLEWMQLGLKFFLSDKLVHHFAPADSNGSTGKLPLETAGTALAAWGIPEPDHLGQLRKFYDNAMMGGDGDNAFNSIEAFNYLTDLEFAEKLRTATNGDFSAAALTANPARVSILGSLLKLFPRTGEALFMNDTDPNALKQWGVRQEYWDGFARDFDATEHGGDGDGALDDGEVAMGLLDAKVIENLYELFDANHDTYLVRAEGNKLFAALGIYDSRIIDAFYADVGLNAGGPTFWQKLRLFFSGDRGWHWLRPYDFHVRLVQLMPQLLDKEGL